MRNRERRYDGLGLEVGVREDGDGRGYIRLG